MSHPFSYLLYHDDESQRKDFAPATTATFTDGSSTYSGIDTPSTTDGINTPTIGDLADNSFQGTPSTPEPTVLLSQIQQAAEDVSQLVGRFGYKMAKTVQRPNIKKSLFADHKLLRLPCLKYADNFTCRVTYPYDDQPINYAGSAPLLWWLWNELIKCRTQLGPRYGKLEFTPAGETDIVLPYTISINLTYKCMELTASYGGLFHERRVFNAPIADFRFPQTKRYGKLTIATLNIDQHTYQEEGCLAHTLDYLMPRPGSIWRSAMGAFDIESEETLVVALARTCNAEGDIFILSEDQTQQYLNLLQRFPPDAREYIIDQRLGGKKNGPYSRMANQSPGSKD